MNMIAKSKMQESDSQTVVIQPLRAGMTLIELLIVIVILSLLTAAALPILTPTTSERRIREASRALNSYISQAQAKSIGTQRPYGIALKRLSTDTDRAEDRGACVEVFMVEQPAPYAGFNENSRVRVALNVDIDPSNNVQLPVPGYESISTVLIQFVTRGSATSSGLPAGWTPDLIPSSVLRPCDEIVIAGTRYEILTPAAAPGQNGIQLLPLDSATGSVFFVGVTTPNLFTVVARPINDTGQVLKPVADQTGRIADDLVAGSGDQAGPRLNEGWLERYRQGAANVEPVGPYWSEPMEYQVLRQPTPTSAPPLQLPEGTAIDLQASGTVGDVPLHATGTNNNDQPIFLMFSPDGFVERLQFTKNCPGGGGVLGSITAASISDGLQAVCECAVTRPTANISLLIGSRENIPAEGIDFNAASYTNLSNAERAIERAKLNWLNLESRWVTIGAQTGNVVTTENAFVEPSTIPTGDYDRDGDQDGAALEIRMGQIQAAQEYVREMRRIGGR